MTKYHMRSDEGVILKNTRVIHGSGLYTGEIMLTNLNFVWTRTGFMGFTQTPYQYPLHQIKVFNGRAEARKEEHSGNVIPKLEISFIDGSEEHLDL